jgi:hypothetical protein
VYGDVHQQRSNNFPGYFAVDFSILLFYKYQINTPIHRKENKMYKIIHLLSYSYFLLLIFIINSSCSPIHPYSLAEIKPHNSDESSTFVLMPATRNLHVHDEELAIQWERTVNYCNQIKKAIFKEIDQRKNNLRKRKSALLLIGAFAGMGTAIYSGVEDDPDSRVLVPLGLLSGTTLASSLPSLSQDERLDFLQDKLIKIKSLETEAVGQFSKIEAALVDLGILTDEHDELTDGDPRVTQINETMKLKYMEIESLSADLRALLTNWASECQ